MFTLVTGNANKYREVKQHLDVDFDYKALDLMEIQSLDLEEIVDHKARQAFDILKTPVLVEDVSLVIHSLGALPGPLVKWFLQEVDCQGIFDMAKGNHAATAKVVYGLFDGKSMSFFTGSVEGTIVAPCGQGFGFDSVFVPKNSTKTWAQDKAVSMRTLALAKLAKAL